MTPCGATSVRRVSLCHRAPLGVVIRARAAGSANKAVSGAVVPDDEAVMVTAAIVSPC